MDNKQPSDGALSAYLHEALTTNNQLYERPRFGRPFRTPMFEFIRRAKAHPHLESLDAMAALNLVGSVLAQWEPEATDAWKAVFPASDDPRSEFVDTWDRIKYPRASVEHALYEAKRRPLKPIFSPSPSYDEFISVAGHLQKNVSGPILLPCDKFGKALSCTAITISRYRRIGEKQGILRLTKRGIKQQRKADEFTFNLELFDWQTGEQVQQGTSECYTEKQETQDSEGLRDNRRIQDNQETNEKEKIGVPFLTRNPQFSLKKQPFIPTTSELAELLARTEKLRNG